MSWRSMLEFNHDRVPTDEGPELIEFANQLAEYIRSGARNSLPRGVTYFYRRHHSDDSPLGEPPHGWDNEK